MGRHSADDESELDDVDDESEESPWIAGLITGAMVALIFVITFVLLARTWPN